MTKRRPYTFFKPDSLSSVDTFFSSIVTLTGPELKEADAPILLEGVHITDADGNPVFLAVTPQPELITAWNELAGGVYGTDFSNKDAPMGHFKIVHRVDHVWCLTYVAPKDSGPNPNWGGITCSWLVGQIDGAVFSQCVEALLGTLEGGTVRQAQLEYQLYELLTPS